MSEIRYCRGCGKGADTGGTALPPGWYGVSVSTAFDDNPSDKPYRWLGMFCSVSCLASMTPVWQAEEDRRHHVEGAPAPTSGEALASIIQERAL